MADSKPAAAILHQCPVCHHPQTRIQRKLGDEKSGSISYVCSRAECVVGINLTRVDTWVAV